MKTNQIKKIALSVIIGTGVYLASCNKERILKPTNTGNIEAFFKANEVQSQIFKIESSQYATVTGSRGTILNFKPNTFVRQDGTTVTGEVEIRLKEIYNKTDMILSNKPTMATDGILISGGEICIEAFQFGKPLKLAPSMTITASFPKNGINLPMQFFDGIEQEDQLIWSLGDSTITPQDSSETTCYPDYFCFEIDDINWINCDYYYSDPRPLTDIEFQVPVENNDTNTAVFFVPDNDNVVIRLYHFSNGKFSAGSGYMVPVGLTGTVAAISEINGNYSSAIFHTTITQNHLQSLTFSSTTSTQFKADLRGL